MKRFVLYFILMLICLGACATTSNVVKNQDPCADFDLDVQKVWSVEAKAKVENGFLKYGGEAGAKQASQVISQMDNLTRDWVMLRKATCKDYFVRKLISQEDYKKRTACLDDSLNKSRTLITAFQSGDAAAINQLIKLASEIGNCK